MTPVIFTPFKAGYYNGLFELLGIPPRLTIMMGFAIVAGDLLSINNLFAFRLYSVLPTGHLLHKKFLVTKFYIAQYIFWVVYVVLQTYLMYDEGGDRLSVAKEQWGHIPQQIDKWNLIFFVRNFRNNMIAIGFLFLVCFISLLSTLAAVYTFIVIYGHTAMSEATKRMQRTLTYALMIQVAAFGLCIFFPCFIILVGAALVEFLPIQFSNGMIFMLSISGTSDTVALLVITRTYRNAIGQLMKNIYQRITGNSASNTHIESIEIDQQLQVAPRPEPSSASMP